MHRHLGVCWPVNHSIFLHVEHVNITVFGLLCPSYFKIFVEIQLQF